MGFGMRIGAYTALVVGLLALGACSSGDGSGGNTEDVVSDSLVFSSLGTVEWAALQAVGDSFRLNIGADSLTMWWSADEALRFRGSALFETASVELSYWTGTAFSPLEAFPLDIPEDFVEVNVTAPAKYNFRLKISLTDGRRITILPDSGLPLVSQVELGYGGISESSSSSAPQDLSSSSAFQVALTEGIWGGYYSKSDTSITMVLQLNADQTMVQKVTHRWTQPGEGCRKVEYLGTWRQDLWILTLDRTSVAEYGNCTVEWLGSATNIEEDPIVTTMEFQDAAANEFIGQWPDAGDWVLFTKSTN